MRKPILKQIKENTTLSINKSQFDLVFATNLNKKIKLDQNTLPDQSNSINVLQEREEIEQEKLPEQLNNRYKVNQLIIL